MTFYHIKYIYTVTKDKITNCICPAIEDNKIENRCINLSHDIKDREYRHTLYILEKYIENQHFVIYLLTLNNISDAQFATVFAALKGSLFETLIHVDLQRE